MKKLPSVTALVEELKIIPMKLNAKNRFRKTIDSSGVVSLGRKPLLVNAKTDHSERFMEIYNKLRKI
jgi:hypothetical protein